MNDKKIINAISRIYFISTSLLLFIFLSLCVIFIVLQNGLYLQSVNFSNLKAKQLYIKWNEYLDVSVKEIKIVNSIPPYMI